MKKIVVGLFVVGITGLLYAGEEKKEEKKFEYVGVKTCKMCHKSEKRGNQFGIWEKSKHARAFEALASESAKKVAEEKGIEDPQKAEECVTCHNGPDGVENVSCEDCHGPGSEYKSLKVMKGLYDGSLKPEDYGLVMPTEETCKTCHNEKNPTYKEFKFAESFEKITHPVPEEE